MMVEWVKGVLGDLPVEAMPAELPERVRLRLALHRQGEARRRTLARGGMLALGVASAAILWTPITWLTQALIRGVQAAAAPVVMSMVEDPGMTMWQLGEGALAWGPQVSFDLGASGMIALVALAVPAMLGLNWTLRGRRDGGSA
jgi:hypothetical protein